MRKQLNTLTDLGIVRRHREPGFPGSVDYELVRPGHELLQVATVLQAWLGQAPYGPHELGTQAAKSSIKALVDGWSSTLVRAFAGRPFSLTELSRLIASVNYPTLERRISAMRLCGQIAACPGDGRTRPYAVTPWLRKAAAPLAAAIRWERSFGPSESAPATKLDIESTFLLAVPLLHLSPDRTGTVRLVAQLRSKAGETKAAGAMVRIEKGQIQSCVSRLDGHADGWASGSVTAWLSAAVMGKTDALEIGGADDLVRALVGKLHEGLHAAVGDRDAPPVRPPKFIDTDISVPIT